MGFRAAKISFDGSHYIATPKENFPQGKKRRQSSHPTSEQETERKDKFETAYKESQQLPRKERKEYVNKAMEEAIPDEEQRKKVLESRSGTRSNTLLTAKAGSISAYGNAEAIQTACISMVSSIFHPTAWSERSSKQRITAQKTTECRRQARIPTFSNGTAETTFRS